VRKRRDEHVQMLTVQTHLTVAGTSLESEREAKWQTCCTAAQTGAVQQSTNVSPPDNTTTTTNCHSANMLAVLLASVHNTYVSQFTIRCPYIHMACAAKRRSTYPQIHHRQTTIYIQRLTGFYFSNRSSMPACAHRTWHLFRTVRYFNCGWMDDSSDEALFRCTI